MMKTNEVAAKLPKFNDVISIEVEINSIYEKLRDTFPEDYKHKEILAHAIVGSAVEHGGINFIYNALNGYTNDIDFKVGDVIMCEEKDKIVYIPATEETKASWEYVPIGECTVVQVGMYKNSKLKVEFLNGRKSSEETFMETAWVNHKHCTRVKTM